MQKISTNALTTRKKVEIDGHPYTVRKFGAGEQLRLNQLLREADNFSKKLEKTEAESPELEQQVIELGEQIMNMFVVLFDDGGDGSKSRALIESLSQDEAQELFRQIFNGSEEASKEASS